MYNNHEKQKSISSAASASEAIPSLVRHTHGSVASPPSRASSNVIPPGAQMDFVGLGVCGMMHDAVVVVVSPMHV